MYYVVRIKVHVPGCMWSRFSTYFMVICSQLPITRTPDNSNLFRFPLKVRVIGSRLYVDFTFLLYLFLGIKFTVFQVLVGVCMEDTVECMEEELEASEVRK